MQKPKKCAVCKLLNAIKEAIEHQSQTSMRAADDQIAKVPIDSVGDVAQWIFQNAQGCELHKVDKDLTIALADVRRRMFQYSDFKRRGFHQSHVSFRRYEKTIVPAHASSRSARQEA